MHSKTTTPGVFRYARLQRVSRRTWERWNVMSGTFPDLTTANVSPRRRETRVKSYLTRARFLAQHAPPIHFFMTMALQ